VHKTWGKMPKPSTVPLSVPEIKLFLEDLSVWNFQNYINRRKIC